MGSKTPKERASKLLSRYTYGEAFQLAKLMSGLYYCKDNTSKNIYWERVMVELTKFNDGVGNPSS